MAGLKVNFTDQEAQSEARSFDPIPSGDYLVAITDLSDEECGPNSKNPGKPYWHLELTVQEGPHEDRKLWTNVMLFEGALYSLSQLLKATGNEKALSTGSVPDGQTFVGKKVIVTVKRQKDTYAMQEDPEGPVVFKNEVKGFKPLSAGVKGSSTGSNSLLPG